MLTFDEAKHEYRWDGRIIPSVTQVIQAAGLYDPTKYTSGSADRGNYIHVLCDLDDRGALTNEALMRWQEYMPYVEAWRMFKRDCSPTFTSIELPITSAIDGIRYAGTLDRQGWMNGLRCLWDIKTGNPEPWHNIQTAAYAHALEHLHMRYAVHLSDDGRYKLIRHNNPQDANVFGACLTIANWKGTT